MKASDFFSLPASLHRFADFFSPEAEPWQWIGQIAAALASMAKTHGHTIQQSAAVGEIDGGRIFIHPTAKIGPFVTIEGPAYVGENCEIRHGALLRKNVILGRNCVVGNSCEIKNALLCDSVQVPHFNYVGDSILGNGTHLGAGAILANLRLDHGVIAVRIGDQRRDTGLRKMGAILGDGCEVGCNTVLQPGTILGPHCLVHSSLAVGGCFAAHSRLRQSTV